MMALTELLDHIARDPDCFVLPAGGQPNSGPAHVAPEDVRAFYGLCGGLVIARGSPYEARIVGSDECILANDAIIGDKVLRDLALVVREQLSNDPSWEWYIIADVGNGDYLAIDFGRAHTGRCYDAFWETYSLVGQMPAIATSLTALIERLYETKGQRWYWLQLGFQPFGDADDAI